MARYAARWAKRRLPRQIDFWDLFQSATLGLIDAAIHFDFSRGTPFRIYARKRVYGAVMEPFRRARYREYVAAQLPTPDSPVLPRCDETIAVGQLRPMMAAVVSALPEPEQRLIILRYWFGMDLVTIGAVLGVPTNRTYELHQRALRILDREVRYRIHVSVQGPSAVYRLLF